MSKIIRKLSLLNLQIWDGWGLCTGCSLRSSFDTSEDLFCWSLMKSVHIFFCFQRKPDSSDDRHVMSKHTSIYPNEQEVIKNYILLGVEQLTTDPEIINFISCPTHLRKKFILVINRKIPIFLLSILLSCWHYSIY